MSIGPYILYLPDIALEKIFSFLSYDEVAKNRTVCKKFNEIGSKYLSRGFVQIEKRHATIYKKIKALLPRRESERRVHPLARHCDILSAVETRISMLNMTFMKYMENNLCCFIPGKVIDEIERVLTIVEAEGPPPRTHELLQELRDISSMAMEHFEEQILPNVKMQIEQPPIILPSTSKSSKVVIVQYAIADEVRKVKKQNKFQKVQISALVERLDKFNRKLQRQNLHMRVQSIKLKDQERKLQEQSIKMQEQESTIADIRKHMDEWSQKFADLTSEVRARDDFNCKSPNKQFTQPSNKFHLPNIKPRKAQVLPKTCNQIKIELERKRKADLISDIPSKILKNEGNVGDFTEMLQNIKNNSPANFDLNETQILPNRRRSLGTFISSSFETFLKNPISSIKSRKRKISEDTNIKYGLIK